MKRVLKSIAILLLLMNAAAAQEEQQSGFTSETVVEEASAPRFEDYRVARIFRGKAAPVKLRSREARMYRTMLRDNAKEGVNFAGHYIIATWGCGSGCNSIAFIDVRTGAVYFSPALKVVIISPYQVLPPMDFNKDSRLLKIVGSTNNGHVGTYYYEWKNNSLTLVRGYDNKQVK